MAARTTGLFAIGGHARSGTTMLAELCNSHPELAACFETNVFGGLNQPFRSWLRELRKRSSGVRFDGLSGGWERGANAAFISALIVATAVSCHGGRATSKRIERSLRLFFPGRTLVGDKMPNYALHPRRLTRLGVRTIVIYRDCRDVMASVRDRGENKWGWFAETSKQPLAVQAERWVRRIEQMEAAREEIHVIRYEQLVTDPKPVLAAMAGFLGVSAGGFDVASVHTASLGRWRSKFSTAEIAQIETAAGPTLRRLGYE